MADLPPFMNAYGNVSKILNKIREAQTPPRFTQDFLETSLGCSGGGARPFIPLAKRIGFLGADGVPTELYKSFRNPDQSKAAMTQAIKHGYKEIFARNEYANKLDRKGLENLLVQLTGLDQGNSMIRSISGTFEALKGFADFEQTIPPPKAPEQNGQGTALKLMEQDRHINHDKDIGLNLAYTINLVLPNTTDIAVFNAIFRAIRENLLDQ
jgi:hypothetical protein